MLQRYGSLSGKLQMIELEKDPAAHGLGISLTGNKDDSRARMGVYVAAIDPLGPAADSDGRLLLGDQILSINGEDVRAASQERTKGTLSHSGETQSRDVGLFVARLTGRRPPGWTQDTLERFYASGGLGKPQQELEKEIAEEHLRP
uniref:PDZ domain-containing protein n=1 Tax=Astatotilapia calliptera TaxID=8154 RepID=A0A3P8PJW2_ASTCA